MSLPLNEDGQGNRSDSDARDGRRFGRKLGALCAGLGRTGQRHPHRRLAGISALGDQRLQARGHVSKAKEEGSIGADATGPPRDIPEREFVQIVVEILMTDNSLVGSHQPPFEQGFNRWRSKSRGKLFLRLAQPEAEHEASSGRVFWITGLSGAGKTTVGQELCSRLRAAGRSVTFLDGDALRAAIAEDLGHSADNRRRSAMRNARLCRLLAGQGADVVCATISLFHEVQRWNRENIPGYREIYLRVPIDELRRRDSKGIYSGAQGGDARDVVGLDVPAEAPEAPDLVLDNYGALDVATVVDRIMAVCARRDAAGAVQPASLVAFKTKAESLEALAPLLRNGRVLPQVRFSVGEWRSDAAGVLAAVTAAPWGSDRVIVRMAQH